MRLSRLDRIILLLLFAVCLLGFLGRGQTVHQGSSQTTVSEGSSHVSVSRASQGNGGPTQQRSSTSVMTPSICNPFDVSCIENGVASWLAQQIASGLQPIADWIAHDPADILFYTSDQLTYNNPQVQKLSSWIETVVDSALVIYVILAGYNVLRGVASHYENMRALPTLAVAAVAAHFALSLAGPIIEINNGICDYFRQQTSLSLLTTYLQNLFTGHLLSAGWLVFVLVIIYVLLGIAVAGEMILRIALIDLLLIFMPAWVICYGIPQTEFVARPMTRAFFVTVFIQAIQLATLGLGSLLLAAFSQSHDQWLELLVGIALFYLILRLPNMLGASLVLREATDAAVRAPRQALQDAYVAVKLAAML
jgi:hypothetical protein